MNISSTTASGEIMLFGVRLAVDPIRKSVSLNNLSQYALPHEPLPDKDASPGYASADDHRSPSAAAGSRERKRGVPWTEEEHKLFLLGLQKAGKGDWRGISRSFVKTRTPTQVASHAQKYFLRRCNLNRRRRRSSLFDITTETVSGNSVMDKNGSKVNLACESPQPHTSVQGTSSEISNISFSTTPMAGIGGQHMPEMSPNNNYNNNLIQIQSTPALHVGPTMMADFDLNDNSAMERDAMSLNLSLSLSSGQSSASRQPAFQAVPSFSNGDSMISVA